ncbi:MAG: DUF4124 domain-containing protein [Gammaproteobacteria bacterium]
MLRALISFALGASILFGAQAQADVYRYTDAQGNVHYTDKPATLPAERVDIQSRRTDVVALQARQQEELQRMNAAEEARRQAATQRAEQRRAAEAEAADKAEQCKKARERYDTYMSAQRLYEQLPNGERRYLTDAELDAARASAKASMDVLCQ